MSIFNKDWFDVGALKAAPVPERASVRKVGDRMVAVNAAGEVLKPAVWRGIADDEPFVFRPSLNK